MKKEIFKTNKNINKVKIGILSDIHFYDGYNIKILDKVEKQILEEQPNYVLIPGDILDRSNYPYEGVLNFFKNIAKITKVIIILGNHDIYKKAGKRKIVYEMNEEFVNAIKNEKNLYFLEDSTYIENNICFYGFSLPIEHYYKRKEKYEDFVKEVNKLKTKLSKNNYNIILFHSPINIYKYIKNNPNSNLALGDLIISGHMHIGCLPYSITNPINKLFKTNRSIVSPEKELFPNYSQGRVYKIRDGIIYEGLSKLSYSTRALHKLDFIYHKKVKFIEIEKS